MKQAEEKFTDYLKRKNHYEQLVGLMIWDARTGAPIGAVEQRADVMSTISSDIFSMTTSPELKELIDELKTKKDHSAVLNRAVEEAEKAYNRNTKIPADEYAAFVRLQTNAEAKWEEAKRENDFDIFKPYLKELVAFKKRFITYLGYEKHPYNTLLDDFEPGVFTDTLDAVFSELKSHLIPLIQRVSASKHQPETTCLFKHFPKSDQEKLSISFLKTMGYDFTKGRLDESVHPFAIGINPSDVRVTTKYNENDFRVALLGTIHEGGHALYEQHIDENLIPYNLARGTSMGIHESQSLFWEKFIGQSYSFWEVMYKELAAHGTGQFDQVPLDDFYFALNEAKPSMIRIEADELTYCLHIILRYELEKGLFEGTIEVDELPKLWNDKMEEYLGIRPDHNGEGVLQDVHWSSGDFGYFPSYALGFIYAAQINQVIRKEIPDVDDLIRSENLEPIREWLTEQIHQYGAVKKPKELIAAMTGGGIDPQPLIHYLTEKYTRLYQL
ncbi:carboxypeptidase M32 [Shouchella lehensis]|uniref:Metal-dependent carboxypeptidase n=1 Tax=Shouchella lehensis G1 TaxID=1246626 RepID=A0A060M370_9BACI|nr:carboxypeptidase M32 [Shouchella lehensis]AIC94519.1 carboxypeptidase [Shouchella lehensis G1]